MTASFSDRLKLAAQGHPRGVQARLAAACDVSPPSVNAWFSGDTKTIAADVIFPAARFLNVNPEWLATGRGVMREGGVNSPADLSNSSHTGRLDAVTLGKAMRFSKVWLTVRGDPTPLEKHPDLVLAAAHVVETLEANIDSDDELAEVMARLAAMGGADGFERATTGGSDKNAGSGRG